MTTRKVPDTVTFTSQELKKVLDDAIAEALRAEQHPPVAANGKSQRSAENEVAVIKAFAKAGYGRVVPHQDVMTFRRWVERGYRPVKGSKSLKVKNLRLFHRKQVAPLSAEERAAMTEQSKATVKRHDKTEVVPISTEASPR